MKARAAVAAAALATTVCATTVAFPTSAQAGAVPTGATASSTGVVVNPGSGINASLNVTGAVGALIGPIVNPVLDATTQTLVNTLVGTQTQPGLLTTLVSALTALTSTSVGTPPAQSTNPSPGFPDCTAAGWSSQNCYSLTSLATPVGLFPLVYLSVPTARGYTNADPSVDNNQPMSARAQIADPVLTLLGIPIGDLGVVDAKAVCPTSNSSVSPSAAVVGTTTSAGQISLLGGLLTMGVQSGTGLVTVSVAGSNPVTTASLSKQLLSYAGLNLSVESTGTNAIKLTLKLALSDLLGGLGLSSISNLFGLDQNTLALTVTVGPGSAVIDARNASATAVGLEVKVGLSGSMGLNVAGLVGAALTVSPMSGTGDDDLLDIQVGRASCTGGVAVSNATWYPPGQI